jgi:hypothetical protein
MPVAAVAGVRWSRRAGESLMHGHYQRALISRPGGCTATTQPLAGNIFTKPATAAAHLPTLKDMTDATPGPRPLSADNNRTVLVHVDDDWRAATLEQWHRDGPGVLWAVVSWRYAADDHITVRVSKQRVWMVE